jgi:hypothetical protein
MSNEMPEHTSKNGGIVLTVRRAERTTGKPIGENRTGTKVDDCNIVRIKQSVRKQHLNVVVELSGFASVSEWHDGLDECGLYAVGSRELLTL